MEEGWGSKCVRHGSNMWRKTFIKKQAKLAFSDSSCRASILLDGLTGNKPVSPRHHHYDEDQVPSDLPGEEHAALTAGLPLLSFIPLLPPSPTTSLSCGAGWGSSYRCPHWNAEIWLSGSSPAVNVLPKPTGTSLNPAAWQPSGLHLRVLLTSADVIPATKCQFFLLACTCIYTCLFVRVPEWDGGAPRGCAITRACMAGGLGWVGVGRRRHSSAAWYSGNGRVALLTHLLPSLQLDLFGFQQLHPFTKQLFVIFPRRTNTTATRRGERKEEGRWTVKAPGGKGHWLFFACTSVVGRWQHISKHL